MIEFTATHFDELCREPGLRERIGAVEGERKAAVKRFWLRLLGGLLLSGAALYTLIEAGWFTVAWIAFIVGVIATVIVSLLPLSAVKEGLKHPVLESLARKGELEFIPDGFDPPAYASARNLLFGSGLSSQTFSDLFHGKDGEGRGHAVYEACLQRRAGKNTVTVFSGQVYAVQRRPGSEGVTAIVPDRKLLNFFKPASDMERVRIEGDEEFERRFEVYSTHPLEARQLLFDSELRRLLRELRQAGGVRAYVGPEEALIAVAGKDRFEPGTMFRSRAGEERVKLMFDDVCASLAVLKRIRAALG